MNVCCPHRLPISLVLHLLVFCDGYSETAWLILHQTVECTNTIDDVQWLWRIGNKGLIDVTAPKESVNAQDTLNDIYEIYTIWLDMKSPTLLLPLQGVFNK